MNPHDAPQDDELETLLDAAGDDAARAALAPTLRAHPERRAAAKLQRQIDSSLARMFAIEPPSEAEVASLLQGVGAGRIDDAFATTSRRDTIAWAAGIAAAAALGALALWQATAPTTRPLPSFTPQPLASIYRAEIAQGFEPYYECRDAERFAATFAQRQGAPLKLLPMGMGARMLGLSYPGGLSRDTTAMLCLVDAKPVMVFVDRAAADQPAAAAATGEDLHVFRRADHGLVFYEVTPLPAARALDAIQPLAAGEKPTAF